jgi:hypothetical protein
MNARAFTPFLTNTPAQTPQTVPKVSSYMLTVDCGSGGRSTGPDAAVLWGCEVAVAFPVLSQIHYQVMTDSRSQCNFWMFVQNKSPRPAPVPTAASPTLLGIAWLLEGRARSGDIIGALHEECVARFKPC